MNDDERRTPDSLSGKLGELFEADDRETDEEAEGAGTGMRDAGAGAPDTVDDPTAQPPRRPTDPPF